MNPTASSPKTAQEGLAEKFGELSQGLAANSGGNPLSALLISLINLIIEALRSITWPVQEAAAPVEADPETLSTPRHGPDTKSPAKAPLTAPAQLPRPRKRRAPKAPAARAAPAPVPKNPAIAPSENRRLGSPRRQARPAAKWARATAPPQRYCKIRASAPADLARPYPST
jgi:hypothetical protein